MIHFFNTPTVLKKRTTLKKNMFHLMKKEGKRIDSINIIFCTDKELLEINKKYLQHNYYTDIITFDLTHKKTVPVNAELYISTDRVRDNAKNQKNHFSTELHRVIFHGLLHLCGYRDKTEGDIRLMRQKEEECLKLYKP